MNATKTLVVLANSFKHHPSTCIAGREVTDRGGHYEIGPWIRPVSTHDEGGLYPSESQLTNGRSPVVFDFVQIELTKSTNEATQPENWLIASNSKWKCLTPKYEIPGMNLLVEAPQDLWLEKAQTSDRISATAINVRPPKQSLFLIPIKSVTIQFGWRQWDAEYKQRRRALFAYKNKDYDLGITDSAFLDRYRSEFPPRGQSTKEFKIGGVAGCFLVVSLAPAFNGFHFKVVATIIEV